MIASDPTSKKYLLNESAVEEVIDDKSLRIVNRMASKLIKALMPVVSP